MSATASEVAPRNVQVPRVAEMKPRNLGTKPATAFLAVCSSFVLKSVQIALDRSNIRATMVPNA